MTGTRAWRVPVGLLGLVTIGAYGLVLYGFGAFVAPIRDETGWSNASISAAFSISTLLGGVLALVTGQWIDRRGARPVMACTLVVGSALLIASSSATSAWAFVATWGLGGAVVASGLYYNATMAVTAAITPDADRPAAFTMLTVIGGLASPVAFPLAGAFVAAWGWRGALRAMVAFMVVCTLPGLWVLGRDTVRAAASRHAAAGADGAVFGGFDSVGAALHSGAVVRWLAAGSAALAGLVAIQVHHVAALEAAGIAAGTAALMAGIRGLLSLPGRAGASWLANRWGLLTALRAVYVVMAVGTTALLLAGSPAWAWAFVVLTGVTFGSISPLQGLYAADLYGRARIGSLMGMQQLVFGAASALGPFALGLTVDLTDSYTTLIVTATVLQVAAMVSFRSPNRTGRSAQTPQHAQ